MANLELQSYTLTTMPIKYDFTATTNDENLLKIDPNSLSFLLSQGYGEGDHKDQYKAYYSIDIAPLRDYNKNAVAVSIGNGKVIKIGQNESKDKYLGNYITIWIDTNSDGLENKGDIYATYGHLASITKNLNDHVSNEEVIGVVGKTGYVVGADGTHLHFQMGFDKDKNGFASSTSSTVQPCLFDGFFDAKKVTSKQKIWYGQSGNNSYSIDNPGTLIFEKSDGGTDTVSSSVSYILPENIEELTLQNNNKNIDATGNALNNKIKGNNGNNILSGGAGADTLSGGKGADTFKFFKGDTGNTKKPPMLLLTLASRKKTK